MSAKNKLAELEKNAEKNVLLLGHDVENSKFDKEYIKPIFYLIIGSVFQELISKSLGSRMNKLLFKNKYFKHCFLLFVIYFSQELGGTPHSVNPSISLLLSIGIWLIIQMFTKVNMVFTILMLVLLVVSYILQNYSDYYEKKGIKESHRNILRLISKYKKYLIGGVLLIGFLQAVIQASRKQSNFSFLSYMFQ